MNEKLIGRQEESDLLNQALNSGKSELIALIGRRRVGKTFLVRQIFGKLLDFELTGVQHTPTDQQLGNFADKLTQFSHSPFPIQTPDSWLEAFRGLRTYLSNSERPGKKIIFFDELPWIANPKSGFLESLGYFWNDWAGHNNVVIILCGSSAGWMIRQVMHHKGSLHNRITVQIHLKPFTLGETELFLKANHVVLNRYQITQVYMVTGGIPHYLKEIKKDQSVAQNIDRLCFSPHGLLIDEFEKLYYSLFDKPDQHIAIIKALAAKWKGLTRLELLELTGISDGGTMSRTLIELEQSDFIREVPAFSKSKKTSLYRLIDNYSLFYLKFIDGKRNLEETGFIKLETMPAWKSWCGYAFENICLIHIKQIKSALGISGIFSETGSYSKKGDLKKKGFQIDLLINRSDGIINICEIKFYDSPFTIDKRYGEELRQKRELLRKIAPPKKTIHFTFITALGLQTTSYSTELVQSQVNLDQLFC